MIERLKAVWKAFLHPDFLDIRDPLTGALTPREFNRLAERLINRARKGRQVISLVFIDADGLKEINDTKGHKAGDFFLKELSQAISANIRPLDICTRWHGDGGDEFVLLFPDTDLDGAKKVAKRIQKIFPNFSWGATGLGDEGDTIGHMVERAEEKMYWQKREKREGTRL